MAKSPIPTRQLQLITLGLDWLGLFICFNVAYRFRLKSYRADYLLENDLLYIGAAMLGIFYIFHMYTHNKKVLGLSGPIRAWLSTALLGFSIAIGLYLFGGKASAQYGRGVLFGGLFLFGAWSSLVRVGIDRWAISWGYRVRWLVLGEPKFLKQLWSDYQRSPTEGALQFLTPDGKILDDLPIVGKWSDLSEWLERDWSGVVVCPEQDLPENIADQLLKVRLSGTRIFNLTHFYEDLWQKVPVYFLDRSWLMLTEGFSLLHNPIGLRIKRLMDVVLALLLLPIALPLVALSALAIFFESGLPILFTQTRTGFQGRNFTLYKLRTMRQDAEKHGAQWAKLKDKRITPIGNFLRKTRLDELPQLWNVLIGDMSFIGPRPERPEFNKDLEKQIPHYALRHIVRPGITGWAQVLYPYGASVEDSKQKLQYDLYYIKAYSVSMDLMIVVRTVRTMLFGAGR